MPTDRHPSPTESVDTWLEAFAAAVRTGDPAAGTDLFLPTAAGFGTVADSYRDADELARDQWSVVWPSTNNFQFDTIVGRWTFDSGEVVAVRWHSTDAATGRIRHGRATLVLCRVDSALRAAHSHFSMLPSTG